MKLSNKILVGFLGSIFVYLTAAFAEVRFRGTPNFLNSKNSVAETVDLTSVISHLVIQDMDSRHIKVAGSNRAQLEVRSFKGEVLKQLRYTISGDTLTLHNFEEGDGKKVQITVFVPESTLKTITVNSATAILEGLQQQRLHVAVNGGRVWMSGNLIQTLQTDLSNKSFMEIEGSNLDTLSANIESSQLQVPSNVALVRGSIKDNSLVRFTDIQEIQLKKDASSNLQVY